MIVSITGGTGFIGQRLASYHLQQGDIVRVLTRGGKTVQEQSDRLKQYCGDLAVESVKLESFVDGADILYHCAGEITNNDKMQVLHVEGTRRLIQAASGRIGRWVQLSSTGAYGKIRSGVVTEETPLQPDTIYEVSKAASDRLVMEASGRNSFYCSVLRPSNVYGPTMRNQSLFHLISTIDRGMFFFIGKPGACANYIHVDNVVEALVLCGKMPQAAGHTYILSDQTTIENFVRIVTDTLRRRFPLVRLPERLVRYAVGGLGKIVKFPLTLSRVDALTTRVTYSTRRLHEELNYCHKISIEEGIRQLVLSKRPL